MMTKMTTLFLTAIFAVTSGAALAAGIGNNEAAKDSSAGQQMVVKGINNGTSQGRSMMEQYKRPGTSKNVSLAKRCQHVPESQDC